MGRSLGLQTMGYPIRRGQPASPLLRNLTAAWGFNEASGSALDSSGNGLHLTANNAPGSSAAGHIGNCRTLVRASSQYFDRADETALRPFRPGTAGWTLAFWLYPTVNTVVRCYVSKDNSGTTDREFFLGRTTTSATEMDIMNASGATIGSIAIPDSSSGWTLNQWNFFAVRWDGANTVTCNINSFQATPITLSGTPNPGGSAPLRFGSQAIANNFFPDANYDAAAVWSAALSDGDLALYRALTREYPF